MATIVYVGESSMPKFRKTLLAAASLMVGGSMIFGGSLLAQDADVPAESSPEETAPVTAPSEKAVTLTPSEMQGESEAHVKKMQDTLRRVVELQQLARKQKDVIKLNCVNDKLLQVKQLLNIAEAGRTNLIESIAQSDNAGSSHQFSQITIAKEKTSGLGDEAEGCIGEELIFLGPTEVDVNEPIIPDDPTGDGQYNFDDILEPPGFASPFT